MLPGSNARHYACNSPPDSTGPGARGPQRSGRNESASAGTPDAISPCCARGRSRGQARWGQRPSRRPNALQRPELARTDRRQRRGARRRCSFFLSEKPCLAQGPHSRSLELTTALNPFQEPAASRQPQSVLHPSFQVCTCWAGHRAPQSRGAAAPWPGPRCLGSGASVYLRGPVPMVPMSGHPRRREG